jgi:putative lipoprotein (rSAM/lipoprotein system)
MATMKRMNKWLNSILATILGVLGFAACDDNGEEPVMYGTPTGSYEIKGSVTDENDAPVASKLIIKRLTSDKDVFSEDTVETNANGYYEFDDIELAKMYRVVCNPKDDKLEADSTDFETKYQGGDGSWNVGSGSETVNFKLKEKK